MINLTYVDMLVINELALKDELIVKIYATDGVSKISLVLPMLKNIRDEIRYDALIAFLNNASEGYCMNVIEIEGLDEDLKTEKLFVKEKDNKEHVLVRVK